MGCLQLASGLCTIILLIGIVNIVTNNSIAGLFTAGSVSYGDSNVQGVLTCDM